MLWYKNYNRFLEFFSVGKDLVDETKFYFVSDPKETEHYIGFVTHFSTDKPFWAGHCDIPDGCEFSTAKELFEAPIYDGKSIKDRWDEVVLCDIGGIPASEYDLYGKGEMN